MKREEERKFAVGDKVHISSGGNIVGVGIVARVAPKRGDITLENGERFNSRGHSPGEWSHAMIHPWSQENHNTYAITILRRRLENTNFDKISAPEDFKRVRDSIEALEALICPKEGT